MPALDDEIKAFIVVALACYRKPALVVRDVQAEFGVPITRSHVAQYHPERGGEKKRLGRKWRDLFAKSREEFLSGKVQVGIAHQSYRLMLLQRLADRAEETGNAGLAKEVAEQAAKEVGGAFTNARVHGGPGGGPIPISISVEDQRRALAAKMFAKFRAKGMADAEARSKLLELGVDERDLPAV